MTTTDAFLPTPETSLVTPEASAPALSYSKRYGRGARVFVGLHGWNGSRHSFDSLLPFLPDDATLITLDLPGYGNAPPPASWDIGGIVDALRAQIDALDLPSFALVGNCSGALLGMWLMRETSLPVERVVLIDTFGYMPWYFRLFLTPALGRLFFYSTFANPLGRWLTQRSLRRVRSGETDLTAGFAKMPLAVPLRYLQAFLVMGDYRSFRHVDTAVDIAYGARSFAAVQESAALWQSLWPHARVWKLEGAGHLSVQEAPEQLASILFGP